MFISSSENIGILCRGQSLQLLSKFSNKFDKCFIVNDFNKEIVKFENILKKKEIIHFVSRISKVSLKKNQYKNFNIKSIQMSIAFDFGFSILKSYIKYNLFNLKVNFMPKSFLRKLYLQPLVNLKMKKDIIIIS